MNLSGGLPPPHVSRLQPHRPNSPQVLAQQHQPPPPQQSTYIPHHAAESFYAAHPSQYSNHSAPGSYSEAPDSMAAPSLGRPAYPPITTYQGPQPGSPALHSPHTDAHGRPLFVMPPMAYYQHYQMHPPSPYSSHPSITSAPGMLMTHLPAISQAQHPPSLPTPHPSHMQQTHRSPLQSPHQHLQPQPPQPLQQLPPPHHQHHQHQHQPQQPQNHQHQQQQQHIEAKPLQRAMSNAHGSGPAPGPIPATTPLVVRQDDNGVQWIAFEYSRDRVKHEYTIRCDVESVNVDELSHEFKSNNCVYPRAYKVHYKGNRRVYETECNSVGWALAKLNPNLRDKRGLIQRAVDSWRNSNQDPRLRSRRVRRQAKLNQRQAAMAQTQNLPYTVAAVPSPAMRSEAPPTSIGPGWSPIANQQPQYLTHSCAGIKTCCGECGVRGCGEDLWALRRRKATQRPLMESASVRGGNDAQSPSHQPDELAETGEDRATARLLFGDLTPSKRRKFIIVDDLQRNMRVRVRATLDNVKMDDMPDSHLRLNSVYPRTFYPRQMRSPSDSPGRPKCWDNDDDEVASNPGAGNADDESKPCVRRQTTVSVMLPVGGQTAVSVPRMTKRRRQEEMALNEMGYRISWGQVRIFNGRTLFLQRSLDAYRNKLREVMLSQEQEPSTIPSHFETRRGKRRLNERLKRQS
ncbi:hypothetical protein K470DRAFT_247467 [Piedraia hortae CBS 480.64]|uniref:DUF8032 domain-containing protein n=1 Tax=Piedraia hortae CBS 480.64 TaxID=1314780 RepID=A0A6A7BZ78_9PEZI|nr:hypothetical protein K470DRAFT_247467 [Piedraia hortae CBS 480.64]